MIHLLLAVILTLLLGRPNQAGMPDQRFRRVLQWWYRIFCRLFGVRIHVRGQPSAGPVLSVSNHISWLDVPVLGAYAPVGFLSKSEVRRWPLIGWLSGRNGTVFIRRGATGAASQVSDQMAGHLRDGHSVHVFPEGMTTPGTEVRRFHPRLFQAAQSAGCPVQPVSIRYLPPADHAAPFVDNQNFLTHALSLLTMPRVDVVLSFLPPIPVEGRDRRSVSRATEEVVREAFQNSLPPPTSKP
ncbi:lysophospholipid acyltransferase family protein [Ectothiorhodospira magna]|nr:lysophospholipid acyltransferase family protein [Ectothiorhodospira magna]